MSRSRRFGDRQIGRTPVALLATLFVAGLAACPAPPGDAPDDRDRESGTSGEAPGAMSPAEAEAIFADDTARILADRVMESLGGEEAWEETRFLSFRWLVEREGQIVSDRLHAWDRHEGTYRIETEQGGARLVALFDVDEVEEREDFGKVPAGRAWRDGQELEGAARDSVLRQGYGAFINDTYWLLMPLKWHDPGVTVRYEGRDTLPDGQAYQVVHLSFEPDVGLTNDQYWGYVDPETGRMAAWRFHLQNQEQPGPLIWWEEWQDVGPVELSALRRFEEGPATIRFEEIQASREVPEGALAPPTS